MAFCFNFVSTAFVHKYLSFFFSGETGLVVLVFFKDRLSLKKILFKIKLLLYVLLIN